MIQKSRRSKPQRLEPSVAPPSLHCLKQILVRVLRIGRLTWSLNFKIKCDLRARGPGFNMADAINAIRRGKIVAGPSYSASHEAWIYEVADLIDGKTFVLKIALDCKEDFQESPHVTIVTGFFRRGRRKELKGAHHATGKDDEEPNK